MTTRRLLRAPDLAALEEERLAPWAARASTTRGRKSGRDEDRYRDAFSRDRDRIIHARAFRRLMGKTQVFLADSGDHYRVRLTHSLEVAQIARTCARNLRLNEDLTEAVALAHDLGHPPFGHSGGDVLDELMRDHGGFEHNRHSLRIVDRVERRYPGERGLDLSYEVRESIIKHKRPFDRPEHAPYHPEEAPLLEAQLVDLADGIAYLAHDLDDGLRAGILSRDQVRALALWREGEEQALARHPELGRDADGMLRSRIVTAIIDILACDLLEQSAALLDQEGVGSLEDVRAARRPLIAFSPERARQEKELRRFLFGAFYTHHTVQRMRHRGEVVLRGLFEAYRASPRLLPPEALELQEEDGLERVLCDYVAGMTDRYAQRAHAELYQARVGGI